MKKRKLKKMLRASMRDRDELTAELTRVRSMMSSERYLRSQLEKASKNPKTAEAELDEVRTVLRAVDCSEESVAVRVERFIASSSQSRREMEQAIVDANKEMPPGWSGTLADRIKRLMALAKLGGLEP